MSTTTTKPTPEGSALYILSATAQAIHDLGRVPAGHLYARCFMQYLSAAEFDTMIGLIVETGLVRRVNDELIWQGSTN
jgi:hypothetical protein